MLTVPRNPAAWRARTGHRAWAGARAGPGPGGGSAKRGSGESIQVHRVDAGSGLAGRGCAGVVRGHGPTMVGILPYAGLKWFVYQGLKQQYWHNVGGGHGGA